MSINNETNRVQVERDEDFPLLNISRAQHNAFVYKDYLFVIFGNKNDIEYLDLLSPNPKFKVIPFVT